MTRKNNTTFEFSCADPFIYEILYLSIAAWRWFALIPDVNQPFRQTGEKKNELRVEMEGLENDLQTNTVYYREFVSRNEIFLKESQWATKAVPI